MQGNNMVNDFHSWGPALEYSVSYWFSLNWETIYGTQYMKRRCLELILSSLMLQPPYGGIRMNLHLTSLTTYPIPCGEMTV